MDPLRWLARPIQRATTPSDGTAGTWRAWAASSLRVAGELVLLGMALWAAAHVINLTAYGWRVPNGDVAEYRRYAVDFWTRQPLFHHLPVEYPPLAIIPFTLILLSPWPDPVVAFSWWMAVLVMAGYVWLRHYASRGKAITYAAYLLLGATSIVLLRFDLFPALVTLLALWSAQHRRFIWAYGLLAAGILLKLYPVFLVPLVAIEQWQALRGQSVLAFMARRGGQPRDLGRALVAWARQPAARRVAVGLCVCAGIVVAVFALADLVAHDTAFSGFTYAGTRPLQIESTPASILWLGTFLGIPAHDVYSFQSLNYVGPLDVVLKPLSAVALVAGCLLVYWRHWRGTLDIGHAFVACLCVVLVANKIFSPQYLVWVLPLVAYVEGFDPLWVAIGLLTTLIYPFVYFDHSHIKFVAADWRFLPTIAVRNGLLLFVTLRAIRGRQAKLVPAPTAPAARGHQPHKPMPRKMPASVPGK